MLLALIRSSPDREAAIPGTRLVYLATRSES
jgi:hypothetical protein